MEKKRYIDLAGKTFGRWFVLEKTPTENGASRWKCQCECGKIKDGVFYTSLVRGASSSCGCLRGELLKKPDHQVHNQRNTTYRIWQSMKTRCRNQNHPSYKHYGARGIDCCDEWFNSYDAFLADMGPRPEGLSLDRKDNSKGYCKENCRWATKCEQAGNTRRNIRVIWNCMEVNLIDVARQENVDYALLRSRFYRGQKIEIAVMALKNRGRTFHERAGTMGSVSRNKTEIKRARRKPEELPKIDRRYKHYAVSADEPQRTEPNFRQEAPAPILVPKPKLCMPHKERAENLRRWRNHGWCIARGVQYRGPKPTDWDDSIHTCYPPGMKPKETHFKRKHCITK